MLKEYLRMLLSLFLSRLHLSWLKNNLRGASSLRLAVWYGNLLYRGGHSGVSVYNNDNWDKEKEQKEFNVMKGIGLSHVRICVGSFGYTGGWTEPLKKAIISSSE